MIRIRGITIVWLCCLAASPPAQAGSIHAGVWVEGGGDLSSYGNGAYLGTAKYLDSRTGGAGASLSGGVDISETKDLGGIHSSSFASVDLTAGGGLHLTASTNSRWSSGAQAAAQWVDVIRLGAGAAGVPESIVLNFHVDGVYTLATLSAGWRSDARARSDFDTLSSSLLGSTSFPGLSNTVATLYAERSTDYIYENGAAKLGFLDSVIKTADLLHLQTGSSSTDDNFTFSYAFDIQRVVSYDPSISGYGLNFLAILSTSSYLYGQADADLSHTIRLSSVTLPNGESLRDPITFESGFELTAVPEPSSLTLLAAAAVCLAARFTRRRRTVTR